MIRLIIISFILLLTSACREQPNPKPEDLSEHTYVLVITDQLDTSVLGSSALAINGDYVTTHEVRIIATHCDAEYGKNNYSIRCYRWGTWVSNNGGYDWIWMRGATVFEGIVTAYYMDNEH